MIDNQGNSVLMIMYGKSVGGAELQFIELANYLARNHHVRLISLGGDGAVRASVLDQRIELKVVSYNGAFTSLFALAWVFLANLNYPSRRVITTSFYGNLIGYALNLFHKRRLVSLETVSKCMKYPVIDRFVLLKFDVLIAGANDIRDYLVLHGQDSQRIQVMHNWVDFLKRTPSQSVFETRQQLRIANQTIIGCIGRLHPQKGQLYLVRAFAKIIKELTNTILLLVGDGCTRGELEDEVAKLDLNGKVVFTGTVLGDDYNNLLSSFDVYVQPSVFEGLPRTLLDAMYMGKMIVATEINGNMEAIQNEVNGLLVPSEDADALAVAILRLLRKPEESKGMSELARTCAVEKFSMEKQLKKIEQVVFNE